jgi:hypothetical protein
MDPVGFAIVEWAQRRQRITNTDTNTRNGFILEMMILLRGIGDSDEIFEDGQKIKIGFLRADLNLTVHSEN